jgi:hypothetical protein
MQLFYRGVNYEKTSLILEIKGGDIDGKYRGREFSHQYPRHIPQMKPKFDLQYRGVAYDKIVTPVEKSPHSVEVDNKHNICPVSIRKQIKIEDNLSQIHLNNIRSNLERRIQVAKSKGDLNLIDLLEKEQSALECF